MMAGGRRSTDAEVDAQSANFKFNRALEKRYSPDLKPPFLAVDLIALHPMYDHMKDRK